MYFNKSLTGGDVILGLTISSNSLNFLCAKGNCNLLLMHNKCTLLKQTEGNYTGLRTGHERRKIKSDLVEDKELTD